MVLFSKNKKASLEMGISSIVLIVLAMALIAIFIGSFTGLFSESKAKLMNSILLVDATDKATSSNVIAGANAFRLQKNKYQVLRLSFYNKAYPECVDSTRVNFYCPAILYKTFETIDVSVPIGQAKTLGGVLKIGFPVPRRDYVCSIKVRCGPNNVLVSEQHSIIKLK